MSNDVKTKERVFKTSNFYMLRTPLLPVSKYIEFFCTDSFSEENKDKSILNIASKNAVIREAVLVSSLSLYNELINVDKEKNQRKIEQITRSLVKYLIRMTTRTTPFGLFSGVTRGELCDHTDIKIENKRNKKRARPDMEWIYSIMKKIENDRDILNDISIIRNDLAYINGSRLDIGYISNYGQIMKDDNLNNITASIRNTKQVQIVMELTKKPIKYKDLISFLITQNPNTDPKKIINFIDQLMSNEYLITELRPPLANADPFLYIIEKLEKLESSKDIYKALVEIKDLIEYYNNLEIGKGEETYLKIIGKMKALHECKNYIQVDMSTYAEQVYISNVVSEEIEKVAELMLSLSLEKNNEHLGEYINAFLTEYGDNREIQLVELLDEDKGLGAPYGYSKPISNRKPNYIPENKEIQKIRTYLVNKVIECLISDNREVVLCDEEIDRIKSKYAIEEIPDSLELYFLLSQQHSDVDDITLYLGPNYGSLSAGKSFGRFIDIMPVEINDDFKKLENELHELLDEETVVAELVELPQEGRLSNVSLNWNHRNYELVIATNNSGKQKKINISDLYIGLENKNGKHYFYIKSKSMNKRIIVKVNNMLNYSLCSNIYRFLIEISNYGKRDILSSFYMNMSKCFGFMEYTPRIRYRKTIICPATWKLSCDILELKSDDFTKDEFYTAIEKWMDKWKVPNFIYLQESDNRLLLNLYNKMHLNEIYYIFSNNRNRILTITEIEGKLTDRVTRDNEGKYCAEIVVPIIRNIREPKRDTHITDYYHTLSDYRSKRNELGTFDRKRIFYPGDEWLTLKLYGNSRRADELIGFYIIPFCEQLLKQKDIKKFFFLRYADPEFHIRLRLFGEKEKIQNNVFSQVNQYFKELQDNGLLSKAVIDTYIREVERYGGTELIELAEEVFYYDSVFACKMISYMRMKQLKNIPEIIIVASVINMMEELGIDYETQREIFMNSFDKKQNREFFQQHRKEILSICNSYDEWKGLREIEGGDLVYDLFMLRRKSLKDFGNKMAKLDEIGELWNEKKSILFSLIHMHCNRMFGASQKEQLILATTRHTLHALNYFKQKKV